jgi:hypothetical protein
MRRHDQFNQASLARFGKSFPVPIQDCLEGLLRFPVRMLGRERLHLVKRKRKLNVHRLFAP